VQGRQVLDMQFLVGFFSSRPPSSRLKSFLFSVRTTSPQMRSFFNKPFATRSWCSFFFSPFSLYGTGSFSPHVKAVEVLLLTRSISSQPYHCEP